MKRIAVIGLGAMGGAMAASLVHLGWHVTGFDPAPQARENATKAGVHAIDSLDNLSDVEFVVLSLPNAALVRNVVPTLLEIDTLIGIVDTTTSEPATSRDMAELAAARHKFFVDSPVSGGKSGAANGSLSAFVGGSAEAVAACTPALEALTGGNYQHLGEAGSGNVVKLINNALAAINLATVGEALAIAHAWGVDPEAAVAGVSGASGASRVSSAMYPNWVLTGSHDSGFTMGLMTRDLTLALDIASQKGEHPQLLGAAGSLWANALEQLGGAADFTEIAKTVAPQITDEIAHRRQA